MFDIISCEADPQDYGFKGFFQSAAARKKILMEATVQEAAKHRNKKSLIMLKDHAFDEGAIKLIAEKRKLCLLIDLGSIIKTKGVQRAIAMSKMRTFLGFCNRFGAYYAFVSFAEKKENIRTPDELCHIAMLLGLNRGQAEFALKMLPHFLS